MDKNEHPLEFRYLLTMCPIIRYWRKNAPNSIRDDEKVSIRATLIRTLEEPENKIAVQVAVSIAKAAR